MRVQVVRLLEPLLRNLYGVRCQPDLQALLSAFVLPSSTLAAPIVQAIFAVKSVSVWTVRMRRPSSRLPGRALPTRQFISPVAAARRIDLGGSMTVDGGQAAK
jgi:hypothetical protein